MVLEMSTILTANVLLAVHSTAWSLPDACRVWVSRSDTHVGRAHPRTTVVQRTREGSARCQRVDGITGCA